MTNPYAIAAVTTLGQKHFEGAFICKMTESNPAMVAFKQSLVEYMQDLNIGMPVDSPDGESSTIISLDETLNVTVLHQGVEYPVRCTQKNVVEDQAFVYAHEDGGFYDTIHALGFHSIHITKGDGYPAFVTGVVYGVLAGYSPSEILHIATLFAAVVLDRQELTYSNALKMAASSNLRYNSSFILEDKQASYIPTTDIEVINQDVLGKATGYPKVAIFDLDGTISTLRVGWDEVMHQRMLEFIAGDHLGAMPAPQLFELKEQVRQVIEHTTGVQTVVQMEEMVRLLHNYNLIPNDERKTPTQYKDIYAQGIRDRVANRFDRFHRGILSLDDLTMKGAIAFITHLRSNGTTVYLASGTDDDDIKHETKALGYAELFDGGIYGSIGDLENDPKSLVMKLAKEQVGPNASFGDVVVFGDGPVEIREAKKAGFLSIGIVSDERQRFGINPAKRKRLILAGSDLLIPDYSWSADLAKALGWESR